MDIEKSKENIQPLRGGRNVSQLETALQAQSNTEAQMQLQLQKEEHEALLLNYEGPDPLDPWFNYIQWSEQSFPKHGHEGHIDKLIKDCLQKFEKDKHYYQDRRFVKLWIRYIDCLANPLELYQRLYNSGIGVECAEFYRAWACYCEESNDFKKADQVYMLGIEARAQPFDELEQAHNNFRIFFAQRMLYDDSPTKRKAASALAETRMALTSLRTFKRRNIASVSSQRTGDSIRSIVPGVVPTQHSQPRGNDRPGASNIMVTVYQDEASTSQVPVASRNVPVAASLLDTGVNVENEKEVGVWNNNKIKMVAAQVVPHQPAMPFTPYEDEELILSPHHMSYCLDDLSVFSVPLCVPDPPEPNKIPQYNKAAVYKDATEYSLEEIRSKTYLNQHRIITAGTVNALTQPTALVQPGEAPQQTREHSGAKQQTREPASALQTLAACALHEQDQLHQLMPLNIPALQNITKEQHVHSPGEPRLLVNLDSKEFSQMANTNNKNQSSSNQTKEKDRYALEYIQNGDARSEPMEYNNVNTDYEPAPKNNHLVEQFNRSLMDNFNEHSVTAHTKSARWELRNIFNEPSITERSIVQPIVRQFDMSKFDIHEDKSMTMALNTKTPSCPVKMDDSLPMDKENGPCEFNAPANPSAANTPNNVNNSLMFEEPACTQVFNFNIPVASTPNMTKFKKPNSNAELSKGPIRKISTESLPEHNSEQMSQPPEQTHNNDCQQNGLSVIMESTREYNSKSGSSSSGQSTRNTTAGYTMRDSQHYASQVNYDYTYAQDPAGYNKRNSAATQPRLSNGQFTRSYHKDGTPSETNPSPQQTLSYPTHDHQYQKPGPYNAYAHRVVQQTYGHPQNYPQSGTAYQQPQQQPQPYAHNQQSYTPPHPQGAGYPSPQHSVQSPGHVPPAFQSPHQAYTNHTGYQNQAQPLPSSPQHVYANASRVEYPNNQGFSSPSPVPQAYANPQQAQAAYQSPAHRNSNYSNGNQYYQRNVAAAYPNTQQHNSYQQQQQMYHHQQQQQPQSQNQYAQNNYLNSSQHNQSYGAQNNSYQAHAKPVTDHQNYNQIQSKPAPETQNYNHMHGKNASENQNYNYQNTTSSQMAFQVYQSPVQNHLQNSNNAMPGQHHTPTNTQSRAQTSPMQSSPMQTSPSDSYSKHTYAQHINTSVHHQSEDMTNNSKHQPIQPDMQDKMKNIDTASKGPTPTQSPTPYKSPTSILRSVRHEQPHGKTQSTTDAGFSNQFLNFISSRNEPKDNANTPKFTNSPNISQKMHKNLYVSSPEQAQLPPSTGPTPMEPKGALQSQTPMQSAKVNTHTSCDKHKDISKRQLDFEVRPELQSEDSRDSMGGKEGKISTVHSRKSIASVHTDGWGMEVDSESSMDCHTFKSTCSNSMLETNDIPRPATIDFPDIIDPFNNDLCNDLLQYVQFPNKTHCEGYVEIKSVPKLQQSTLASFGNHRFSVEKQLGKGTYGSVFSSLDLTCNKPVALKYQKPGHPWEFYICKEIKSRIKDPYMLPGYMDVSTAFLGDNASIFVSELSKYGSLLDVANKIKASTTKCINEHIVMLLTAEMLSIVHYLHKAQIIHADIKPDNFLLMKIPTAEWRTPSLQLIDMGCSIDMSLFPEDTTFKKVITTEGFTCTEMRERRPWTYQTDLYCLAGTVHVILMGSYMKTAHRLGQWNIDKKLPRYMKVILWDKVFTTLLNIPDCTSLPDLMDLKEELDMTLRNDEQLSSHLRTFANVLKCR